MTVSTTHLLNKESTTDLNAVEDLAVYSPRDLTPQERLVPPQYLDGRGNGPTILEWRKLRRSEALALDGPDSCYPELFQIPPRELAVFLRYGMLQSPEGATIHANWIIDNAATSMADCYYGPNSELGRVMETIALGLGLSTIGSIAGHNWRTKVAWATAGWLSGKVLNYFSGA